MSSTWEFTSWSVSSTRHRHLPLGGCDVVVPQPECFTYLHARWHRARQTAAGLAAGRSDPGWSVPRPATAPAASFFGAVSAITGPRLRLAVADVMQERSPAATRTPDLPRRQQPADRDTVTCGVGIERADRRKFAIHGGFRAVMSHRGTPAPRRSRAFPRRSEATQCSPTLHRAAPTASPAHDRSGRRTSPSDRAHTP